MGEYVALKYYFDKELAKRLAGLIVESYPDFPTENFIKRVNERVAGRELKERVAILAEELYHALPKEYEEAISHLLKILGPENETEEGMFTKGYFLMPVAYYVEKYGLEHLEVSLHALYEITKRHTAEYAIRPFLIHYTDETLGYLNEWKKDPNSHVRRLVSEGTRPRLPWAKKMDYLNGNIYDNLEILDGLKNDSSDYVRKSVGNHLNDLSKDHPEILLPWMEERKEEIHPVVLKRGLRTLIKKENQRAQKFLIKK